RRALALMSGVGARSWVTPVLYWRCKFGRVFDIAPIAGSLSPEALQQLAVLDATRQTLEEALTDMDKEPKDVRTALKKTRRQIQDRLGALADKRAQILGETLRIHGGTVQPGQEIDCRVALQMRSPGKIGAVEFTL